METVVKLITEGKKLVVTITEKADRLWLKFPFSKSLMAEIKVMEGAKWHGYDDKPVKQWSILNSSHNRFQLSFLKGENPYAPFEKPLLDISCRRPVYNHQQHLFQQWLTTHYCVWAAEMGCICGDTIIPVNCGGASSKPTIAQLHNAWTAFQWKFRDDVFVRSLCGDYIRLNRVKDVLYKGLKNVITITTSSGKSLTLTPDHEVCVGDSYVSAGQLIIGHPVLTNGKWIDKDGYVRVGGLKNKHPRWTTGGVYEHILVMERVIGRHICDDEIVHHKDEVRHNNHPDNLELLISNVEHARLHGPSNYSNFGNGDLLPRMETIVKIEEAGYTDVYDIVCEDPHRNFVANGIIVHNCGKTLAAIEGIEYVSPPPGMVWWVGPKSALAAVKLEFRKWKATVTPEFFTYEGLVKRLKDWQPGDRPPVIVVFDESSRCKTPTAQRTQACQHLADAIRETWGPNGYVLLMSGSPAPKSPADWHSQCRIACPGYLKEGTISKFTERLAIIESNESITGGKYNRLVTWKDNPDKCDQCGLFKHHPDHDDSVDGIASNPLAHTFIPSKNEIEALYRRMKGLVVVKHKKDCIGLPDKIYRRVICKPKPQTLNAARLIANGAKSAATGLILLRELSDGFQYTEKPTNHPHTECGGKGCDLCNGSGVITVMERDTTEVPCPKEDALIELLDEHDEVGRLVVYAGFTGSLNRIEMICQKFQWETIRVDGRGWKMSCPSILDGDAESALMRFQDKTVDERIVFIGHPGSAGMGLTLTASPSIVYYSNDFNAESRIQSEDRIHRPGMDLNLGATIIDLIHLPTDIKVLDNLQAKRDLQSMSMGDLKLAMELSLEDLGESRT